MIDGVIITPLKRIPDERGLVMHIIKKTEPGYIDFGEVYCSCVYPGVVKGWHIHNRMTLNYVVIVGMIKFVLFDDREESLSRGETMEIFIGEQNFQRITVPPRVWNGFKGIGDKMAMVINTADIVYDPTEIQRCDPHNNIISYDWSRKDG